MNFFSAVNFSQGLVIKTLDLVIDKKCSIRTWSHWKQCVSTTLKEIQTNANAFRSLSAKFKNKDEQILIKIPPTGEYNVLEELAADAARPHHEQPGLPDPGLQVRGKHTLKLSHLQTLPIPNCLKSENRTLLDHQRNRQMITRRGGYCTMLFWFRSEICLS